MRQGRELERQRRHVEVEALRALTGDSRSLISVCSKTLVGDATNVGDAGVKTSGFRFRIASLFSTERSVLRLAEGLEVALAVEFDEQTAALRLGRLGRRVQDAEGALLELDALAPEARALQEQHVGLVEGHARAVDDELRARGRRRRVERIVHDEGLVRGGQIQAVPARHCITGHGT